MDLFEKLENYSTSKNKKNVKSKKSKRKSSKRSSKNGRRSSKMVRRSSKNGRRSSKMVRRSSKRLSRNNSNKPVILDLNNRRSSQDPRKFMFPKDKNVDFRDLMISTVSEYSTDRLN